MCLLIVKPSGLFVPKKHIEQGFRGNSDGAGFSYIYDGKVIIQKGFTSVNSFYAAFKLAEKMMPKSPFVLHMRIGTSGHKGPDNCHPYRTAQGYAFAHNGIFGEYTDLASEHSDTYHFVKHVVDKLPRHFVHNSAIMKLLDHEAASTHSKFAIMTPTKVVICGESAGVFDRGIWYSNTGYRSQEDYLLDYPTVKSYNSLMQCKDQDLMSEDEWLLEHFSEKTRRSCDECFMPIVGKAVEYLGSKLCQECAKDYADQY